MNKILSLALKKAVSEYTPEIKNTPKTNWSTKKTLCYTKHLQVYNSDTLFRSCRWIYNKNESGLFPFSNNS